MLDSEPKRSICWEKAEYFFRMEDVLVSQRGLVSSLTIAENMDSILRAAFVSEWTRIFGEQVGIYTAEHSWSFVFLLRNCSTFLNLDRFFHDFAFASKTFLLNTFSCWHIHRLHFWVVNALKTKKNDSLLDTEFSLEWLMVFCIWESNRFHFFPRNHQAPDITPFALR